MQQRRVVDSQLLDHACSGSDALVAALLFDRQRPRTWRNPLLARWRSLRARAKDTRFADIAIFSSERGDTIEIVPEEQRRVARAAGLRLL
jgi:hypothetical protein